MTIKLKEYRVVASRVTNYITYNEAENESEAEFLALNNNTDWEYLDDDEYEVYTCEEVE